MRTYKPRPQRDRDRRMAVAVRLHAEGLTLRQIAARQSVSYQTVANDLARWDREHAAMPAAIIRLSKPTVKNVTPGATDLTPGFDSHANVIPLRRSA
jgi:lambda repressor-like predicted transcriptional regulator